MSRTRAFVIGTGILVLGIGGFLLLSAMRSDPPKADRPDTTPVVETVTPETRTGPLTVAATGTVQPVRQVMLAAEVPGKIVAVNPAFVAGGAFRAGAILLELDPTDYENAVAMAEAEVTQRQYELLRAQEEVDIARDEWRRLQARTGTTDAPAATDLGALALKEPQLKLAASLLKSAEARLADAQTRLRRTRITAPFNGRLRQKNADLGQYVAPGQALATLYSTDAVEVVVPLASHDVALIPDLWNAERRDIGATVFATFGGERYAWSGRVVRTEGTLDPATRTINAVVRVSNPYRADGQPPLLVGTFAEVEIEGADLGTYYALPRAALREGNALWVAADSTLRFETIAVVQEQDGTILLRNDQLAANAQVITSNLQVVTDGMRVRVAE